MRRVWGAAVAATTVGAGIYLVLAYRVLQTGGLTVTSLRSTCAEAVTGRESATYRTAEDVEIERTYLPLSATCRWSGGSSAELIGVGWLTWVGPVLALAGIAVLVAVRLVDRRR